MAQKILGKNCVLYATVDAVLQPVICARECTLNIVTDEMEVTTISSGGFREFDPMYNSWTITLSGLAVVFDTYSELPEVETGKSIFTLIDMQLSRLKFLAKWEVTHPYGGTIHYEGDVFITNNSIGSGFRDLVGFDTTFRGSGELTKVVVEPE